VNTNSFASVSKPATLVQPAGGASGLNGAARSDQPRNGKDGDGCPLVQVEHGSRSGIHR
jgi:hypothetical protein